MTFIPIKNQETEKDGETRIIMVEVSPPQKFHPAFTYLLSVVSEFINYEDSRLIVLHALGATIDDETKQFYVIHTQSLEQPSIFDYFNK